MRYPADPSRQTKLNENKTFLVEGKKHFPKTRENLNRFPSPGGQSLWGAIFRWLKLDPQPFVLFWLPVTSSHENQMCPLSPAWLNVRWLRWQVWGVWLVHHWEASLKKNPQTFPDLGLCGCLQRGTLPAHCYVCGWGWWIFPVQNVTRTNFFIGLAEIHPRALFSVSKNTVTFLLRTTSISIHFKHDVLYFLWDRGLRFTWSVIQKLHSLLSKRKVRLKMLYNLVILSRRPNRN